MKKAEAISILATSIRPREAKDRARYDEAVKMAIEALKSSEQTAESAQNVQDGNLNWAIPILSNLMPASVVTDAVQNQIHLEESVHRIKQLTGISIDDLIDLFAQGYELKAPSTQTDLFADTGRKVGRAAESAQNASSCARENDVIFRQAAIDCVNHMRFGMEKLAFDVVTAALLELPAPTIESEIIRCKDCKHRDKYGCCKYWKGLAMGDIPIATDDYDFCSYAKRI